VERAVGAIERGHQQLVDRLVSLGVLLAEESAHHLAAPGDAGDPGEEAERQRDVCQRVLGAVEQSEGRLPLAAGGVEERDAGRAVLEVDLRAGRHRSWRRGYTGRRP